VAQINMSEDIEFSENVLNDTIDRLNAIILQKRKDDLSEELRLAEREGDIERVKELVIEIQDLKKKIFSIGERRMLVDG